MIVGYLNRYGCQVVMYVYIHCDAQYVKWMSSEIPGTATVGPLFPYYSHRNPLKYGIWEGGPTMGVPEEILKHGKLMEIILIIYIYTYTTCVCRFVRGPMLLSSVFSKYFNVRIFF